MGSFPVAILDLWRSFEIDVVFELRFGALQVSLDCRERYPALLGDVFQWLPLDVSLHPGDPKVGVDPCEGPVDLCEHGLREGACCRIDRLSERDVFVATREAEAAEQLTTAQATMDLVNGNAPQPGAEALGFAKRIQLAEGRQEGILNHVLSFGTCTQESGHASVHPADMTQIELMLRVALTRPGGLDQCALVGLSRTRRTRKRDYLGRQGSAAG
jgi:hypothetical protein